MKLARIDTYLQRVGDRPRVLVRLSTDDGIQGWAEVYNHGPDLAYPPLLDYMFEQIKGMDATSPRRINQFLHQSARFPPGALGTAAIAAIDHALWDIAGKALDVPVYRLLGGAVRDRVRVYAGLYDAPDVSILSDRAERLYDEGGFTAFKLSPYRMDRHRVRYGRMLRELGDWFGEIRSQYLDWDFAFDAHACLTGSREAIAMGDVLQPYDPLFLEEPLRPEHLDSWRLARQAISVPLATGESLYSAHEFLNLFNASGTDIAQPDICVVGGMTQMLRIASLAELHQVQVAPHNPMGPLATAANVHFAAVTENFSILEYKPEKTSWCPDPYLPVAGHLELRPDRAGWGVEIDLHALASQDWIHWQRKVPVRPDGSTAWM